ncbi:MAG: excinuclease ABC subunit C [Deltaproteobacteria bacterium HGW-Deltaproteobacteria-1]|nr:MAG: excinuclease ABC subunit C [Deltaproteobacteria bacterium HGW-Deltaproteobacteria-1]
MNMEENSAFKEKMLSAPRSPGVYLMLDERARVIYVGKANDLKSRVASYFTGRDTRPMAPFLMARVHDIDFITTTTEKEALILENNLIKKHRPRYNVILRDDKTYYHLSLNPKEPYPRLQLVRKRLNDDALYFGPYPSGMAAKETLRFVQQVFPLRTCRSRHFQLRTRPCLEYQIGRCLAPWLISDLKKQMEEAAQDLNYEEAARLRDRIHSLEHALEKQNVDWVGIGDQDVLGFWVDQDVYQFCILFVQGGKLLGSKSFTPVKTQADKGEIISSVLKQYYDSSNIPDEIILPDHLPDEKVIAEWLADQKEKKVRLTVPVRGVKKALLEMAAANARELLTSDRKKEEQKTTVMRILQEKLSLTKLPRRIECYDISNISGKNAVGSMVTFQDGDPDKSGYRRFRIKAVDQPDDYGMMREVLKRRFAGDDALPDLVVVDGGKGQLNIALSVLNELKIKLDVIGLAKEERGSWRAKNKTGGKVVGNEDRVYLPRRKDAVYLSSRPAALSLLQRVRDEAHRFAVSYHHRLKQKTDFRSILDAIPDIGSKRKKILLTHFGSASQVQKSSLEELQRIPGIGKDLAGKIYSYMRKEK